MQKFLSKKDVDVFLLVCAFLTLIYYFVSEYFYLRDIGIMAILALLSTLQFRFIKLNKASAGILVALYLLVLSISAVFQSHHEKAITHYFTFAVPVANLLFISFTALNGSRLKIFLKPLLLLVPILPLGLLWGYYAINGTMLGPEAVMALLQTNSGEAMEYLYDNVKTIHVMVIAVLIVALTMLIKEMNRLELAKELSGKKLLSLVFVVLLANVFMVHKYRENCVTNIVKDTKVYMERYKSFGAKKADREKLLAKIQIDKNTEDGVYVMVIGESQNRTHMNAYGYERNNTPWLSSMRNNEDFLFFEKAYPCHTHTVPVLTYALTVKNQYNKIKLENCPSLLEIANEAGFLTVWLSNQIRYSNWDTPVSVIADAAKQQTWLNKNVGESLESSEYDMSLVNALDKVKVAPKMLIVVHLMGNHGSYNQRYPKEYQMFKGDNNVDRYDNSILYNDAVMKALFEKASKIKNFKGLVYFSDHADGINKGLSHDAAKFDFDMTYIPMYMYFSKEYQAEHADKINALKSHEKSVFTDDLICNLMISIMGIKTPGTEEPNNDLTSDKYDSNINRFKTLYGRKSISEDPNK